MNTLPKQISYSRADFRFAPSQRGMSLQCNVVSHWLGANFRIRAVWFNCHWAAFSGAVVRLFDIDDTGVDRRYLLEGFTSCCQTNSCFLRTKSYQKLFQWWTKLNSMYLTKHELVRPSPDSLKNDVLASVEFKVHSGYCLACPVNMNVVWSDVGRGLLKLRSLISP